MIIIASFYNNEYLMPWWLKNVRKYADHGILINDHSTDRSVEIIKKYCPSWEIVNSKYKYWDAKTMDKQYVSLERRVKGYRLILACTEFLEGELPELKDEPSCYKIKIFYLIDDNPDQKLSYGKPLLEQKKSGRWATINNGRFLHNYKDGNYAGYGIHHTNLPIKKCKSLIIKKCKFSPWTKEFIKYKLSAKDHIDPNCVGASHHFWDKKRLFKEYKKELSKL